jgi:adenylate cyclase
MKPETKRSISFLIITVLAVFLINTISNMGSILTISVIGPLVFLTGDWVSSQELFSAIRKWEWLTMAIPFTLVFLFISPAYVALYLKTTGRPLGRLKARWILDVPMTISMIGATGWFVEEILFLSIWFRERTIPVSTLMVNSLQMLLAATVSFVISFFCLELLFRKMVIPRAFPDGKLSTLVGNTNLSIRGRFLVYFLSAVLFPFFIFSMFVLTRTAGEPAFFRYPLMIGVLTLLGFLLTLLISSYFRGPLRLMKQAVLSIRDGRFDIRIPVTSNDELGMLSESLNDLGRELQEKSFMKETFGKVVDPTVRDHLLGGNAQLGGEERMVTVLFTDIRNYTGLTEKMTPETVVLWLNRYFDTISQVVTRHGGIVNKYIGDAVMALFGAPQDDPGHAAHAAAAAEAMVQAREALNRQFAAEGLPQILAGIGVHTGPVLAGNIGSSSRMEYTVIGDTVNVASRVEKSTKELKIPVLFTEDTVRAIPDRARFVKKATCRLQGRSAQLNLYSIG